MTTPWRNAVDTWQKDFILLDKCNVYVVVCLTSGLAVCQNTPEIPTRDSESEVSRSVLSFPQSEVGMVNIPRWCEWSISITEAVWSCGNATSPGTRDGEKGPCFLLPGYWGTLKSSLLWFLLQGRWKEFTEARCNVGLVKIRSDKHVRYAGKSRS